MDRMIIELPADRNRCGALTLIAASGKRICGAFPVAARASDALAAAHGNPDRDPLFRYGDTPTGSYRVNRVLRSGRGTGFSAARFGPHGLILIEALSGDAACAEANGRFHLLIIGGELAPSGQLRSTAGSLRLHDDHQRRLVKALAAHPDLRCDVFESERRQSLGMVHVDARCEDRDPVELPALQRAARAGRSTRELMRGGAAGAMAFGFAISFISAPQLAHPSTGDRATWSGASATRDSPPGTPQGIGPSARYTRLASADNAAPAASYEAPRPAPAPAVQPAAPPAQAAPTRANPGDTNALRQLQSVSENPTGGGTQMGIDTAGKEPAGSLPSVSAVPLPAPAEAPLTAEQQQRLNDNQDYQRFLAQQAAAQKALAEAAAKTRAIEQKLQQTTDSAARAQIQVDLVNSRQQESNERNKVGTAKLNAEIIKKKVVSGAPDLLSK